MVDRLDELMWSCFTAFGDIVILDMEENMNSGKTHKYFSWAAEHAMVPEYTFFVPSERAQSPPMNGSEITFRSESETRSQKLDSLDPTAHALYVGEKRPDYVFKADDDALIVLGEMERRLRVAPRKLTFFGCKHFAVETRNSWLIDPTHCCTSRKKIWSRTRSWPGNVMACR